MEFYGSKIWMGKLSELDNSSAPRRRFHLAGNTRLEL